MGRDSDATGGPAGGSASDSQGSQAGSMGAGSDRGGRQSNPFGGSLSGPMSGRGGTGTGVTRQPVMLTDKQEFAEMMTRNRARAQARFAAQRQAKAAQFGEQYAGYAGLSPNDIANMRTDPAMRGLSTEQATAAMAAATGATATPADLSAAVAAKTYGYRRGDVTASDLADAATAAIGDERGLMGKARDAVFGIDRTVTPTTAAKFGTVTPDFTTAPSYAAGLPDVTSAYSRGLAYTDPATGMPTQDIAGQAMEVFGDLALAASPALIGAAIGGPLASAIGGALTRGMMTPDVSLTSLAHLAGTAAFKSPEEAIAGINPVTKSAMTAVEMAQLNERLGIGQTPAQRQATVASARRSKARQALEGGGERMGRQAQEQQQPVEAIEMATPYVRPAQQQQYYEDPMSIRNLVALTSTDPYSANIYGLSPMGNYETGLYNYGILR